MKIINCRNCFYFEKDCEEEHPQGAYKNTIITISDICHLGPTNVVINNPVKHWCGGHRLSKNITDDEIAYLKNAIETFEKIKQ